MKKIKIKPEKTYFHKIRYEDMDTIKSRRFSMSGVCAGGASWKADNQNAEIVVENEAAIKIILNVCSERE